MPAMTEKKSSRLDYKLAGVSISRGNQLVERIKPLVRDTARSGVLGGIGGFGGLFDLSVLDYTNPVLVAATDGVGTKLKLAIETGRHDSVGIDLVAMCANDLLVQGAEPLFFLDYYASGHLDVDVAESVIKGIAEGCSLAGCALIGGETAEMPGMYRDEDYDLAGFCVGIVEKDRIIDGGGIREGDTLIGLAASGAHSNGYSLIRRILTDSGTGLDKRVGNGTLAGALLEPTRIYVKPVLELLAKLPVKGMAHITGGGLLENLPRILPSAVAADIDCCSWQWPELFQWLQRTGNIDSMEMYTVFNCGIGLVLVVDPADSDRAVAFLNGRGEKAWKLGQIVPYDQAGRQVILSA